MSQETDLLLGYAFGVLTRCRTYFILQNDVAAVEMIEDDFRKIESAFKRLLGDEHAKS
jgi:hypothetical protein